MKAHNKINIKIITAFLAITAFFISFLHLAEEIGEGDTLSYDSYILKSVYRLNSQNLDAIFVGITNFGSIHFITIATISLAGYYMLKRNYYKSLLFFIGVSGAVVMTVVLKTFFSRDRPDLWMHLVQETSFSFPSGHATASSALAICLIVAFWQHKYHLIVIVVSIAYVLIIGFSRLYLGVHYPTDILGGWLLSTLWISSVAIILAGRRLHRKKLNNTP